MDNVSAFFAILDILTILRSQRTIEKNQLCQKIGLNLFKENVLKSVFCLIFDQYSRLLHVLLSVRNTNTTWHKKTEWHGYLLLLNELYSFLGCFPYSVSNTYIRPNNSVQREKRKSTQGEATVTRIPQHALHLWVCYRRGCWLRMCGTPTQILNETKYVILLYSDVIFIELFYVR